MKSFSLGQLRRKPMELRSELASGVERLGDVCACISSGLDAAPTICKLALFFNTSSITLPLT